MKNIFLLSIIFVCFSKKISAQQTFGFDANTSFISINENSFLAYTEYGDRVLFQELNFSGDLVWEDTLFFENYTDSFAIHDVVFFPTRDSVLILSKASLGIAENPLMSLNDTLLCQFTLLNLVDREFQSNIVDTLYTPGRMILRPYNIDSIFLFHSYRNELGEYEKFKTISINTEMNVSAIAPVDSIVNYYGYFSDFYIYDDTIYHYSFTDMAEQINMYNSQVSHFYNDLITRSTNLMFNYICGYNSISRDSLFVLKQGTQSGAYQNNWLFIWSDLFLTTIKSVNIPTPQYSQNEYFKINGWYKVLYNEITQDIFILATASGSFNQQVVRLFIYDKNFNLKCERNINNVTYDNCKLTRLGENIFLNHSTNENCTLTMLNNCEALSLEHVSMDFNAKIYPNPFTDVLNIDFKQNTEGVLYVFDNFGREIYTQVINSQYLQIDLSKLNGSAYWVRFDVDNQIFVKKVVKVN